MFMNSLKIDIYLGKKLIKNFQLFLCILAVARTAGSVSLDCAFVLPTQREYSLSSNQTMEGKRDQRISSKGEII